MKLKKKTCFSIPKPKTLIDIGVEDDHTFFITNNPNVGYVLTHNSFPDIDSDVSERDNAVKLLQEYFGHESVIPVSSFAALKPLSLIKDLSKFHNVPFEEVNSYTSTMIQEVMKVMKAEPGFDAAQYELTFEDLAKHSPSFQKFSTEVASKFPGFQEALEVLFKQQRSVGRHAGGLIITDNARDGMPLIKAKGGLQTPWSEGIVARHLEEFGLLKFDVLGLGTLRVFEETIRRIIKKEKQKKFVSAKEVNDWFFEKLHPDNNPMDDLKVFQHVYWEGRYANIFQFVKPNVQSFMKKMKPRSVLDLAIATSIYRPGPMGLKAHDIFLKNRANPNRVKYVHPVLKEVLDISSGLLIFQEQLQLIVHKLSGMPLEDTDSIRKAFTKKDKSNADKQAEEIKKLGEKFIEDSMKHSGITREAAAEVWKDFEKWTAYGFNRAHATAYAITSWQCAWFLTYYPDEWIASYLDFATVGKGRSASGDDPKTIAIAEAKELGYKIGKPDINHSEENFVIGRDKTMIPSFSAVKGVGKTALYEIQSHRPYNTIYDLVVDSEGKWRHSKFNKRAFGNLIKTGAFESMNIVGKDKVFSHYREMYEAFIPNIDLLKRTSARKKDNDVKALLDKIIKELKEKNIPDWSEEEKNAHTRELTGDVKAQVLITPEQREYLEKASIHSIDDYQSKDRFYWFTVSSIGLAESSTGNLYLKLYIKGETTKKNCIVWGITSESVLNFDVGSLLMGKLIKDEYGFKSQFHSLRVITDTIVKGESENPQEEI